MDNLYPCFDEMLVLVHNGFLFRNLYRARSPFPNDRNSFVSSNSHPYQITGENGACTSKSCYAVNCYRHASVKARVNHGKSLFHLMKSRSYKAGNWDMSAENTNFIESLIR